MDILELIQRGEQNVASHDYSNCLREAAERFLGAYAPFEGFSVVAASPQAERVLGAAMMLKPDLCAGGQGRTVVLDVNIASGTLLARAARRLRDRGNEQVLVAVALYTLASDAHEWEVPDVSQVVIAGNDESQQSALWECAETGDHCVVLAG
ncbi:hypothetical protein ACFQU3_00100 [Terrabacter sp. GCM10028922]|uniref:hypothetical protein n=1 Tax=Terrabacter sp. GCM10028922 TaxID=3273428 RepID=UPI00361C8953